MPKLNPPLTDTQILRALHMKDHEGRTLVEIGAALGRSRNAIAGMLFRVRHDTEKHDLTPHLNGTQKPNWWKDFGQA